jgi:WD40-like Beta Propeller Repeat
LWRSRSDGTERLQLTYSPARVAYPFISPDGRWVSYQMVPDGEDYVISMDGGPPQSIPGKNVWGATWSPDGNVLVFGAWLDRRHTQFQFYDLRTKQSSVVPGPNDLLAVEWIAEGMLVAVSHDRTNHRGRRSPSPARSAGRPRGGSDHQLERPKPCAGTIFNTRIGVAPDGSAVFTRDIGTQEIYALTVKWP